MVEKKQTGKPIGLARRERQIMDALYRLGRATAAQVRFAIPDPPSDSAVRAHLRSLEEKGLVRHKAEEKPEKAMQQALSHLLETFFDGSPSRAVAALLDLHSSQLDAEERMRLVDRIEKARKEGR
jgi:predicted transcriptional regulator